VEAVKRVTFQIERGEVLSVVGGSGCGKSTLAKMIAGILDPDEGDILWEGRPLAGFSRQHRARLIQMVFQDPYASLNPKLSVGTQLREVLRMVDPPPATAGDDVRGIAAGDDVRGIAAGDDVRKGPSSPSVPVGDPSFDPVVRLLESVGLSSDCLTHYPFQFSGGQRQRIAIARALAMNPQLLIADEPLSALDVTTQAQILDLLERLKGAQNLTLLFITHDLAVAAQVADRMIVLKDGEIVEEGPTSSVIRSPRHPYTQALLNAVPVMPC
jgi:ABC-type glutathione transport system ATPase component